MLIENLVQLLLTTFDADRCTKYHYAVLLAAYHPTMEIPSEYCMCFVLCIMNLNIVCLHDVHHFLYIM